MNNIGIEIELTGVTRMEVVRALENLFQNRAIEKQSSVTDMPYKFYKIKDWDGQYWTIVRDRSIESEVYKYKTQNDCNGVDDYDRIPILDDNEAFDSSMYKTELVSPVLNPKSLKTLFLIVNVIKALGGITNHSCGIHIHVDKPSNVGDLTKLFKSWLLKQDEAFTYFSTDENRLGKYCKRFDESLVDMNLEFDTEKEFLDYLTEKFSDDSNESRSVRYYALNFYSIIAHNTVEFRLFNSSLNTKDIASIISWVVTFAYPIEVGNKYMASLGQYLIPEIKEGA